MRSTDIADFYQQLGLLIRSNLPLPDSLLQIGKHLPAPDFKQMMQTISERVGRGEKLARTMQDYPHYFDPIHIRLIQAGESTGTLDETLFEVARFSRFCQLIANRMRDIVAYPLFTIHLCLLVVIGLSLTVIPAFQSAVSDMFGYYQLPALSRFILSVGMNIHDYWIPYTVFFICLATSSVWLFTPGIKAHRMMMRIINAIPGSMNIIQAMDSARFTVLCAAFIRQNMPLNEAVETAAQLADHDTFRRDLKRVAQQLQSGRSVEDAMANHETIDPLIRLTFTQTPERDLPDALTQLSVLFEHRVTLAMRSASNQWNLTAITLITLLVGTVVIGIFHPITSIMSWCSY
ncbi:MAG: hypothetical protein A2498_10690 [Lentisphaerae bacterium RIFOXYC12_FULL_60_16]|nr:MAG: hypothetical protein A2498_10690 [Lentisphaerae bacterium RIFOXYC12_FULL_60_16]